jgi:hypothetical protein
MMRNPCLRLVEPPTRPRRLESWCEIKERVHGRAAVLDALLRNQQPPFGRSCDEVGGPV